MGSIDKTVETIDWFLLWVHWLDFENFCEQVYDRESETSDGGYCMGKWKLFRSDLVTWYRSLDREHAENVAKGVSVYQLTHTTGDQYEN